MTDRACRHGFTECEECLKEPKRLTFVGDGIISNGKRTVVYTAADVWAAMPGMPKLRPWVSEEGLTLPGEDWDVTVDEAGLVARAKLPGGIEVEQADPDRRPSLRMSLKGSGRI